MSLAIVGKVGASITFLGTSSIVGCVLIKPELFGIYSDVYMYAISVKVDDGATEELTDENFKCKFADSDSANVFDCEVFKLKTKSEKHYKINDTNDNLVETKRPTVDELKSEHKIFNIKFSGQYWDQTEHIDKNIEIIPKPKLDEKKYANLKPLFAKHKGKVIGKTNYFVAKAVGETINFTTENTFKCSFDNKPESKFDCTITKFADSESGHNEESVYESLTFAKPTSTVTAPIEITQHKHYLIKFTNDKDKQEVKGFKRKEIHLSNEDGSKSTKFQNVKPSFYNNDYDGLFIV